MTIFCHINNTSILCRMWIWVHKLARVMFQSHNQVAGLKLHTHCDNRTTWYSVATKLQSKIFPSTVYILRSDCIFRCNRQRYSPTWQYTQGYKSPMKIIAFRHPWYIIAMNSMAGIYQGYKNVSHDVNTEIKPLWIQNISVLSTKDCVKHFCSKKFTFTLNSCSSEQGGVRGN